MITFSAWPLLLQVELALHLRHASAKERGRHIVETKVTRAQSVLRSFDTPIETEHEVEAPPEPQAMQAMQEQGTPKKAPAAEPLTPVVEEPQERVGTDTTGDARYKPRVRRARSEYRGKTSRLEANVGMTIGGEGASSPPGDRPSPPR